MGNQRFIIASQTRWFPEITAMFSEAKPELNIPTGTAPTWLVWVGSFVSQKFAQVYPNVDKDYNVDTSPLTVKLGFTLTPEKETLTEMMEDFIEIGAVDLSSSAKIEN